MTYGTLSNPSLSRASRPPRAHCSWAASGYGSMPGGTGTEKALEEALGVLRA